MIREGLEVLLARDSVVEDWLRTDILPAYDAHRADPGQALSAGEVIAALERLHAKATAPR